MRRVRVFLCALALAAGLSLVPATASFAQSPTTSPSPSAYQKANWSKYLGFAIAGIGVAVLGMAALGYLIQGPGFRKLEEDEAE